MKKIIYFLIIVFGFSFKVNAQELIIKNKVISFPSVKGYGLQGFTTTNKYLVCILVNNNDTKAILKIYSLDNYQEVKTIYYESLGHANDVTYNAKENKLYIIENGTPKIFVFDAESFSFIEEINTSLPIRSLTYLSDYDLYAGRVFTTGYFFNNDFTLKKHTPFIVGMNASIDVGRQGWSYYKDKIYYSSWSWIRKGGDGTNKIYVYSLQGEKLDEITTNNQIGELEGVSFINDQMILGFDGYGKNISFYLEEIPPLPKITKKKKVSKKTKPKSFSKISIIYLLVPIILIISIFLIHKKRLK